MTEVRRVASLIIEAEYEKGVRASDELHRHARVRDAQRRAAGTARAGGGRALQAVVPTRSRAAPNIWRLGRWRKITGNCGIKRR